MGNTNYHILELRYLPANNYLPSRYKIIGKSITLKANKLNGKAIKDTIKYFESKGFEIIGSGEYTHSVKGEF